jgi:nitroreductase
MEDLEGTGQYRREPVRREHLGELLSALSQAPSASNAQPWEAVAVESEGGKRALAGCLLDAQFRPLPGPAWFLAAPLVLVMAIDTMRADAKFGRLGSQRFALVDLGAAVQNLLLAGREAGLRGTILRNLDHAAVRTVLGMPDHVLPVMAVAIGYCDTSGFTRPRLPLKDFAYQEQWGRPLFDETAGEEPSPAGEG